MERLKLFAATAAALFMSVNAMGQETTQNTDPQASGKTVPVSTVTTEWNQWRGPSRNGKASGIKFPSDLKEETLLKKWSVNLGPSYSGPLVVGDRVFVTEAKDRKFEVVKSFDLKTGDLIWEKAWEGSMTVPFFAASNGNWIRSTPAYADGMIYAAGMRDVLVCLDAKTGDEIWRRDFPKESGTAVPTFGFVCSPLVEGDHVYVQAGGGFLKLDRRTGQTIWTALSDGGGMNGSAFSSPMIATIAGRKLAIVLTRTEMCGVDISSGEKVWGRKIPAFRGMNILTPTVIGEDEIFTSTYGGTTQLLKVESAGGTGAMTMSEKWNLPVQGYMSSPVVIGDYAYVHLKNQRFACFDLKNGVEKWRSRPYGKYASMVAAEDKILALDQKGELLLVEANPEEFKLLDSRRVGDDSWAHVAVTKDNVVVRNLKDVTVFEWAK